jgi:hypothetical protein
MLESAGHHGQLRIAVIARPVQHPIGAAHLDLAAPQVDPGDLGQGHGRVRLAAQDHPQRWRDLAWRQDPVATWYSSGWNRWWLVRFTTSTSAGTRPRPRAAASLPNPPPMITTRGPGASRHAHHAHRARVLMLVRRSLATGQRPSRHQATPVRPLSSPTLGTRACSFPSTPRIRRTTGAQSGPTFEAPAISGIRRPQPTAVCPVPAASSAPFPCSCQGLQGTCRHAGQISMSSPRPGNQARGAPRMASSSPAGVDGHAAAARTGARPGLWRARWDYRVSKLARPVEMFACCPHVQERLGPSRCPRMRYERLMPGAGRTGTSPGGRRADGSSTGSWQV